MNKIDWRHVIVGSMMGVIVAGCSESSGVHRASADGKGAGVESQGDFRAFQGTIVSLRPATSTMLISRDDRAAQIPVVNTVKWDTETRFYLDNQPATLLDIQQYMTVTLSGRMRKGQFVAETARFSSVLPANVRRAEAKQNP